MRPHLSCQVESTDLGKIGCRHEARQWAWLLPAIASPAAALAPVPTSIRDDTQRSTLGLVPGKHSQSCNAPCRQDFPEAMFQLILPLAATHNEVVLGG